MKYNDNKNDNIENDDMDIKSHLDTSLELSGINVSEDLINRTLEAIRKQATEHPADQQNTADTNKVTKKVVSWNKYIRGFAGVAAAALIVVAGYGMLNSGMKDKSDSYNMESTTAVDENTSYDKAKQESATENSTYTTMETEDSAAKMDDTTGDTVTDNKSLSASDSGEGETAPQYSIAAGFMLEKDEDLSYGSTEEEPSIVSSSVTPSNVAVGQTVDGDGNTANDTDIAVVPTEESKARNGLAGNALLTFRSIFLSEPEKAAYITITDEVNGSIITMTDQAQIIDFYSIMDKHQFTYGTESTSEQNYTVEINDPDVDATYVMTVGNRITVSYADNKVSSQSIYEVLDRNLLTQDLKDFITKYSK